MKRYQFRTTKRTEWIEEILDKIPSKDRSIFIRRAICWYAQHVEDSLNPLFLSGQMSHKSTTIDRQKPELSHKEADKGNPVVTQNGVQNDDKSSSRVQMSDIEYSKEFETDDWEDEEVEEITDPKERKFDGWC